MTRVPAYVALLTVSLLIGAAAAETSVMRSSAQVSGLLASVRAAFQEINPTVERVTIMEIRLLVDHRNDASDLRYVLLAHVIGKDQVPGNLNDELFGVFELDADLARVVRTIGSFPTPRGNDYSVWIEAIDRGSIVLAGEGATYRDHPGRWIFESPSR